MGTEARVIVLGKRCVLQDAGLLDYPEDHYEPDMQDAIVVGHTTRARTSEESFELARGMKVDFGFLERHEITRESICYGDVVFDLPEWVIGARFAVARALEDPDTIAWFLPNY